MVHVECCDALEIEVERFAATLETADPSRRVPSCPDWSVEELALHLGTIHRWAERLVATRAPQRVDSSVMSLDLGPVDATWLRRGGASLLSTLRDADPADAMWVWGTDPHVRWWSRRQLHETLVHRIDLELAQGQQSDIDGGIACDAIDEFLSNLASSARFSPGVRELRGDGERLRFRACEPSASWTFELRPDGFATVDPNGDVDAELAGTAAELLLVLYRRRRLEDSALLVSGERPLVARWLGRSALG